MHILIYNGVNFSTLGVELDMLGQSSVLEPPEAPQYRRTTLRCRYSFFEATWADNYGLITQLRDALKTNQGVLQWTDDNGGSVLNRRVVVGPNDLPDQNAQGTFRQEINFSFWYLEFPATDGIVPNTLSATFQGLSLDGSGNPTVPSGPALTLSTVEHWTEGLDTKMYSEWRADRRRVGGVLAASGKILGNSVQSLGASQNALFAAKDALMAQFTARGQGRFTFGSFNQIIRGIKFDAVVDQAQDLIKWSLHAEFTRTPAENNYAQLDLGIEVRDQLAAGTQGITEIILSGKIESESSTHAYAALAAFQLGMIPSDYTLLETANTERIVDGLDSNSTFIDLMVREIYRQNKTGLVTWTGTLGSTQTLGILEDFSNAYDGALFSEFRSQRQRAGGVVQMSGRYQLAPEDSPATLYSTMQTWVSLLAENSSGRLAYGSNFNQVVRIVSFTPKVVEGIRAITWQLTAHFTRFPNESGYAVCDFRVKTSAVNTEGAIELTLTGKIEAQSEDAALTALAGIREASVPDGYVTLQQDVDPRTVIADTDGTAFIELSFAERYRLTQGQIVTWSLKVTDTIDTKTGMVRSIFAGSVSATGDTLGQAYSAGLEEAQTLGAGKYPMVMRSDVSQVQKLFLTTGQVFVEVGFTYEYLQKGGLIYIEATAEVTKDSFGQDVQMVSGYVAGPDNATCKAAYIANVRNTAFRQTLLVLSEKHSYSTISIPGTASLDTRFDFVLTLHRTKDQTDTAMKFSLVTEKDFLNLTQTVNLKGTVYAGSNGLAQAFLIAFLSSGNYGTVLIRDVAGQQLQAGYSGAGNPLTDFFELQFDKTYQSILTGTATILESEVTVDVVYAGIRWVEQPIPGSVSILQNTGVKCGARKVSGKVKAANQAAAQAWAATQHAFISGDPLGRFEDPPQVAQTYEFLPLTNGVTSGAGANVRVFVVTFNYAERLPSLIASF